MDDERYLSRSPTQISPPVQKEETKAASPQESKQELNEAIKGSGQVLTQATTALMLFPDTLTLDRAKLTITRRAFFSSSEVMSIRVEDILNAMVTIGPIFGSIKIVSRVMNAEKPYTINRFWRNDAVHLKRIIQGYVIALQRHIDCSALPTTELVTLLDKLGEDDHVSP